MLVSTGYLPRNGLHNSSPTLARPSSWLRSLTAWFFSLAPPSASPSSPRPPYPTSRGMTVQGMKRISSTRIRWWTMKMPRRQPSGRIDAGWGRENDSRELREGQHVSRIAASSPSCLHLLRGSRFPGCAHGSLPKPGLRVETAGNSGDSGKLRMAMARLVSLQRQTEAGNN
ncbi:hypothetical protein FIBSPDRAFT_302215 [Athelia psychrophila]|uniref:Uncharacterized protein n=1 Tax=Athelia psychrophila TaxID=1759441 RepID=A0A167X4J5_9AGAM|nr:hypothetical protein FIBSPDRAFT_302215 [Fibularhizoctonia sp. CBS 109695]